MKTKTRIMISISLVLFGVVLFGSASPSAAELLTDPQIVEDFFSKGVTEEQKEASLEKVKEDLVNNKSDFVQAGGTEEEYQQEVDDNLYKLGLHSGARGNIECLGGNGGNGLYNFNQSELDFEAEEGQLKPGEVVHFKGNVTNGFNQPLVNAAIWVKVYRKDGDMAAYDLNGDYGIDSFYLNESVDLDTGESKEFSGEWKIPNNVTGGNFYAALVLVGSKKYNLSGVNFLPGAFKSRASFRIEAGEASTSVYFDKNSTKINNIVNDLKTPELTFGKKEDISVSAPLVNESATEQTITVTKELYSWDTLKEENIVRTEDQEVVIPAGGTEIIDMSVPEIDHPEYVVRFRTDISEIDIRFTKIGIARGRISYPTLSKFPLEKGDDFKLFSCFHSMSGASDKGQVKLTLMDRNDNAIAESTYDGLIPGSVSAFVNDFQAEKGYSFVKLKVELYNDAGTLIDSDLIEYDCAKLNFDNCQTGVLSLDVLEDEDQRNVIVVILGGLATLIIMTYLFLRRAKNKKDTI